MSNRCKCGFYNQLRHHTKISGGACEYYRIAELEQQLAELKEAVRNYLKVWDCNIWGPEQDALAALLEEK